MSLRARRFAALLAATVALFALAAPAAADFVVPFQNWKVSGNLGLKKLGQNVQLPSGSTFNGSADLTTGMLTGDVSVPQFTATIRVLGIPANATLRLVEAAPATGTLSLSGANVTINAQSSAILYIRRLSLGPISIPFEACRTASPVVLPLSFSGPLNLAQGFTFTRAYSLPRLTDCGLFTPVLTALLSGPDNPFSVSIAPPA